MGPLVLVLLGAVAVFWYLGLLTPQRLTTIGGVAGLLVGLWLAARGGYLPGFGLMTAGAYLTWAGIKGPRVESAAMTPKRAAKILGVREGASIEDIRAAHRLAIASAHPDKGGTDAASSEINEARDVLIAARMKD